MNKSQNTSQISKQLSSGFHHPFSFGGRNPATLKPPQLLVLSFHVPYPQLARIPPSSSSSFFVAWASFAKMALMRKRNAPAFRGKKLNKLHQHRLSMLGSKGGTTATYKRLNFYLYISPSKISNSMRFSLQPAFAGSQTCHLTSVAAPWDSGMSASEGRC